MRVKSLLGIKRREKNNKIKLYFLGIPYLRIVRKPDKYKIYFLGLRVLYIATGVNLKSSEKSVNYDIILRGFDRKLLDYESYRDYTKLSHSSSAKVAVLGVLPPETSGIAGFNYLIFCNNKNFDFFTYSSNVDNLFYIRNYSNKNNFNVYATHVYENLDLTKRYAKKIYVLGNSYHNVPYLKLAIREVDKKHSWLHIHEANLLSLLFNFWGQDIKALKYWLEKCYPEKWALVAHINTWEELAKVVKYYNIYGTRIIKEITGISNFIVNNDICENILAQEINDNSLVCQKVFLPFPDLSIIKEYTDLSNDYIYVGSWGIPGGAKLTHIVADAVCLLNDKYNIPAKLLLGGYNLVNYCKYDLSEKQKKHLVYFDSPSDEKMFSLMKRAEVNVQLREQPHGESSGAISQLFGMNKKIITNEKFIDSEFEKYCYVLKAPVTAEALAVEIKKALQDKEPDYSELVKRYSFSNLAGALINL